MGDDFTGHWKYAGIRLFIFYPQDYGTWTSLHPRTKSALFVFFLDQYKWVLSRSHLEISRTYLATQLNTTGEQLLILSFTAVYFSLAKPCLCSSATYEHWQNLLQTFFTSVTAVIINEYGAPTSYSGHSHFYAWWLFSPPFPWKDIPAAVHFLHHAT